jgi:hypothetical protein
MSDKPPVKLAALDEDDLAVISAHLQDAILRVGDIRWLKNEAKLALVANRFDHTAHDTNERRHCGLQVSRVRHASARNIDMADKTAVLSLLAITYSASDNPPEGEIELTFAGGGTMRLAVECIEAAIADLSKAWTARIRPDHEAENNGSDLKDAEA